jgi:iron complex outermembrane recepter protein
MKASKRKQWAAHIGTALISMTTANTAWSQDALEEITVTASKRESSLQDTPVAISAMTGEQLEQNNVRSASDLAAFVPGLEIGNSTGNMQVALRGVSNDSVFLAGDPAVAFHVDGVFRGRQTGGNSVFLDLERVEVLKGPQGTLYGRNATAGSINVITAKPTDAFGGYVEAVTGNYDQMGARGAINLPVIEGKVAMRAAFLREVRDGYWDNGPLIKDDGGDVDDTAFRLHTLITPNDRLSVLLTADYAGRGGVGESTQTLVPRDASVDDIRDPYKIHLNTQGKREDDFFTFSAETNYSFDNAKLTYLGAYHDSSVDLLSDYDRNDVQTFPIWVLVEAKQQSHELRLASTGDNVVDWLLGAYYFDEDAQRASDIQISAALRSQTIQPDFDVRSMAAFSQATWNVSDTVRLTGGLRFTRDEKSENNTHAIRTLNGVPTVTVANYEADWDSWDWTVGADWYPVDDTMLYAKIGTGFKSGGFNDPLLQQSIGDPLFEPEEILSYQIGHKSRFLGGTLQLNSEVFYYDYTDLQINQLVGANNITTNAADAKIKGVETELLTAPIDHLQLSLAVAYLDTEFGDFQTFNVVSNQIEDLTGERLAKSPEWSVTAGAQYELVLPNQWQVIPHVAFNYRSKSKLRIFVDPGTTQPDWTRTDVSVNFKSPSQAWNVQLYGNNLEDEVVWTNGGVRASGSRTLSGKPPLMYGLRVRYSFE